MGSGRRRLARRRQPAIQQKDQKFARPLFGLWMLVTLKRRKICAERWISPTGSKEVGRVSTGPCTLLVPPNRPKQSAGLEAQITETRLMETQISWAAEEAVIRPATMVLPH